MLDICPKLIIDKISVIFSFKFMVPLYNFYFLLFFSTIILIYLEVTSLLQVEGSC